MAKAKKETTEKKSNKLDIIEAFENYVLEEGYPTSIHMFCKAIKIKEGEFYDTAGSFLGIEKAFWLQQFEFTLETLEKDETYAIYTTREKVLAFFFTFLEHLKDHRSFILICKAKHRHFELYKVVFQGLRQPLETYVNGLIAQGMASEEIADRKYLDRVYAKGFWLEFMFILKFWVEDDSPSFEDSDAAIEKSVNLAFDLLGRGPLDAMFDFGKFMFNKMR